MFILDNFNSEYYKLLSQYLFDYDLRISTFSEEEILLLDHNLEFQLWSSNTIESLKELLFNDIKKCNENNIFFRGCNFKNYRENHESRLSFYLNNYDDSNELDYINDEINYYESSMSDIINAESTTDGFSILGIENFSKLSKIIEVIGIKQFELSTNKILDFLYSIKNNNSSSTNIDSKNLKNYNSRIFTSKESSDKLESLVELYGDTKQNIANYSFVFHQMKKDGLIFERVLANEFIEHLSSYEITIDRIKPKAQIGGKDLKTAIYNRV